MFFYNKFNILDREYNLQSCVSVYFFVWLSVIVFSPLSFIKEIIYIQQSAETCECMGVGDCLCSCVTTDFHQPERPWCHFLRTSSFSRDSALLMAVALD